MSTRPPGGGADEPNRTVHAQQAFEFTDLFGYKFGALRFGERKLKLVEPDGMSTAGGKLARQSMVLELAEGEGRPIVCGWLDALARAGEIRSYNLVRQQFEARYKDRFDLQRDDYEHMLTELEGFLRIQKMDVKMVDVSPPAVRPELPRAPVRTERSDAPARVGMMVLGIVVGLAIGYVIFGQ